MTKRVEVTITIGDRKLSLEGPEDFVRAEVERFAGLERQTEAKEPHGISEANSVRSAERPQSERSLIAQKKPKGHLEIVAVLAYHLAREGQAEFTAEDIRRGYKRANERPPKVMEQALRDAKNLKDYLESGSSVGRFRLSAHGERTVEFDLPRAPKT